MALQKKHRTIPVFIPERACPFRCIYCNQYAISGQKKMPTDQEIKSTIEEHLSTIDTDCSVELGFFGGTFTGIPLSEQKHLLSLVQPYLKQGRVGGIRLSTRPDYIDEERVNLLRQYGVNTVELGVQSLDDEVLRTIHRGYNQRDVYTAARLIQQAGMEVGMQMMIGLPGDTVDRSLETAQKIIDAGATNTRIYPTLVVKETALARMYEQGLYKPLSLDEAVTWTAQLLPLFEKANVTVLRVGLHPTEGFISGSDYLAGPFHVSFRELVESRLWKKVFQQRLQLYDDENSTVSNQKLEVRVASANIGSAVGYGGVNRDFLQHHFRQVHFIPSSELKGRECLLHIEPLPESEKNNNKAVGYSYSSR